MLKGCIRLSLIILAIICICLCYKWGDWRNWKLYYSTMLFYFIGVLTSHILKDVKPLWLIHGFLNDTSADYFMCFTIFPSIIILFLSNYPKRVAMQILYIFSFTSVLSIIEYIGFINSIIVFYNGWNMVWSFLVYIGMFPLLRLHYKKPLWAWTILLLMIGGGMFYFNIPFNSLN